MSKDLTNTVNDQLIEQNPVEALEQLKVFATDQSLIQEWDSEKANALYQEYLSNLDQYDGKQISASKAYFDDYLQGKIVNTKIGPVRISSKSKGKIHDRMRDVKYLAIPYIPEVLMTGDVSDLVPLNKDRPDSVVGYYHFTKTKKMDEYSLNIMLKVAVDEKGNLLYFLGASKEKNQSTGYLTGSRPHSAETGFDSIESYDEDEINIDVQVLDKNGNILTEEQAEKLLLGDRHLNTSNLVKGRTNNVKTAKGTKVSTVFAVMEADKVIASHTATGAKNPEYPQELQPRDRGRDSSQAWVQKTSNDLDPESLGRSGRADTGAPIVGDDLVVESGNGRTMAIKLAYERGNADEYREWLIDEADYFGFKSEQIEQFKQPILVRIRTSDVDRVQFTIESNQDDKLSYSATERAKSDAKRLDDNMLALFSPGDDGDLLSTDNQKFVQAFLKTLGDTEAAQYITTNGKPTQALVARMKAAVFSKAYNDDRLLEMMADQTKPDLQNMLNALGVAAPKFIEAQAVSRGNVQDISSQIVDGIEQALDKQVANAIIDATNVILSAKQNNQDIVEFVKQQGLFSDLPEGVAEIAVFLSKNSRSAKKMSIFFKALAKFSEKQAIDHQTMDLFGDSEPVSIKDAITYAEMILEQHYGDHQITMFDSANQILSGDWFNKLAKMKKRRQPISDDANKFHEDLKAILEQTDIDKAAHQAATSPYNTIKLPTEEQKLSGEYGKGHLDILGLSIAIENPTDSIRSGTDANGKEWQIKMSHHYGYIENTLGADGDELDVFVKNGLVNFDGNFYVVNQINSDGSFDEHKVIIGATSIEDAKNIYLSNYEENWQGSGDIDHYTTDAFKNKFLNQASFDDISGFNFVVLPTDDQVNSDPLSSLYMLLNIAKNNLAKKPNQSDELKPSQQNLSNFYHYSEKTTRTKRQKDNDAAVNLLRQFESGDRPLSSLTDADRDVLAKYTGSGGNLVTADGKKGSAYEYYTPKPIAQGMWDLMAELGFSGGKVLDPCAGMGIFGATSPDNAVVDAVELDAISGNLNKFVNQNPTHSVTVSNFEKVAANTPDSSYDAVITNVPFGNNAARGGNQFDDAKYQNESLETYFILRTLEKLKPNGLAMFITPPRCVSGRDPKEEKLRIRASLLAEFLGAYRLPNKVFGAANADTITDVIVFKKHGSDALDKIDELSSTDMNALIDANVLWQEFIKGEYFKGEGLKYILGDFQAKDDTKYRDVDRVINDDSVANISKLLKKFKGSRIDWNVLDAQESDSITYNEGDVIYQNGQPLSFVDGTWQPIQLDNQLLAQYKATEAIVSKISDPYTAYFSKVTYEQANQARQDYLNRGRIMEMPVWANNLIAELDAYLSPDKANQHWNAIVVGLSVTFLLREYSDDLEMNYLESFARLSADLKNYRRFKVAASLSQSFKNAVKSINIHFNGKEYSSIWRGERQSLENLQTDLDVTKQIQKTQYLNGTLYLDIADVKAIYQTENPSFDPIQDPDWVVMADNKRLIKLDDLCVGNLKNVLDQLDIELAAATDDDIKTNLLTAKQLAYSKVHQTNISKLSFKLNSPLVKLSEKLEFAKQFIDPSAHIATNSRDGKQFIDINIKGSNKTFEDTLTNRVGDYFKNGTITLGGIDLPRGITAEMALERLRAKINDANTKFSVWVKSNPVIQERLTAASSNPENLYFKIANDDSPLVVENISPEWITHGYQNAEIRRQARQFGGINGFNVGLGKTVTALVSVQHAHNIGVKNKTLFVVPGAVLSNWRKEAITGKGTKGNSDYVAPVYQTGDDCLFVGLSVDSKGNASVKSEDYDRDLNIIVENKHKKIFMTYEAFQRIAMRETTVEKYVNHLRLVDTAFAELERTADDEKTQSKIAFISQELVKNKSLISPFFEDMGFDSIVIDEGHAFKNSKEAFDFESAKFLSLPEASSRALDAQAKCWFIRGGSNKNDGVLLLTATPITNSPLEIYSMLSLTVGEDQINKQMLDIRGADDFLKAVCIVENETETSVDGISKDYAMFTGLDNLEVLRSTIGSIANIQDAESVGAVFHLPDSPELSDPILLDKETMEKLKLYQEAYRIANLLKREKPVFQKDMEILAMVAQETGDNFELLAEPFNLINKMNNLSLDSELNKRVTFIFVANQKDAIEQAVIDFNKLNIQVKNLTKIGRYTPESAIIKSYQTKDNVSGKVFTRYDVKVTVSHDEGEQMLILDSIDFGVQQKLEAILDKHKIDFDYATTPKYSALINNIKNELSNPRGLKRDGSLSRIVKQIVFSDMLATHNKIRRLIAKKAGIPLQRITFVSGQYNNEPEKLLEVQAGFNGFDDDNIYNVVIGNKKAEVGLNLQQGTQAIHHLTIGWTPDALTQRNGRGVRQGNMTAKVNIYYYDAEGTFDAYKRRLVNKKDEWITNLLQGDSQRVAIEGGLKKEQYEALINAQGSNISLDDMQLQLEQQERKARANRTIDTQLAHIQTITTAKQNINRFDTFAQWVNKTVDDLGEVNKQIAKITKDMEKIKGGSDRDIKKRDRLNIQKRDLETSQSLIADQIRPAIVEKMDDIAWNEIVKKVGIAKYHKLSYLDQKKVIDDEIPLKVEWTEYLAQNQRVLKSANEELIKLSEDANVLKQNEIDQILEHGYQMLQGQVVTTGTVVKFTGDMPHNAKYGYFYNSENIRVFEVVGGVVKLYTVNLNYSDIGSSIEILNKMDAEYQTALAYFAEFDDLAIIAEQGKLKETQASFLALNILPDVKKYLKQSFEIFYSFSQYRYAFNLPNFPLYLENLPEGTGNWSKFYDMQRNIVEILPFGNRVAESKLDQLSTEKCDFKFVLDFLLQQHLKFKDYDEFYQFVSQTMLNGYGFTEANFKNFDPDQAILAIERAQTKTDLDVAIKDILDATFAQYFDEGPNLYKISSASTYKFINSMDLTRSFWNIESKLKEKIAEFSTENSDVEELNVLDQNDYVYLTGDSYRAKEFIDFREVAKKVDSDIAWYGKKIRGNDGAILKKAPKAPKNTWVMQRKLADYILKEYQEVVKKYDLEFKEAA